MPRMPNHQVAQAWFEQSLPDAKSWTGNMSFYEESLYSFSTVVARLIPRPCSLVVLLHAGNYGPRTQRHLSHAWRASYDKGAAQFHVPCLHPEKWGHATNTEHLLEVCKQTAGAAVRSRQNASWRCQRVREAVTTATRYCDIFRLGRPIAAAEVFIAEAREELRQKRSDAASRAAAERKRYAIATWIRGASSSLPRSWTKNNVYFRKNGSVVETSNGLFLSSQLLRDLQDYHDIQLQVIADKLFVDGKAAETSGLPNLLAAIEAEERAAASRTPTRGPQSSVQTPGKYEIDTIRRLDLVPELAAAPAAVLAPAPIASPARDIDEEIEFVECGACGQFHLPGFTGGCNDDATRFPVPTWPYYDFHPTGEQESEMADYIHARATGETG